MGRIEIEVGNNLHEHYFESNFPDLFWGLLQQALFSSFDSLYFVPILISVALAAIFFLYQLVSSLFYLVRQLL